MNYQTIEVSLQDKTCFIQFHRKQDGNTINGRMIEELLQVLEQYRAIATIIVLEGSPEVFCLGADFKDISSKLKAGEQIDNNPEALYDLWLKLVTGPYITISHVRGKVNAGGIGFVAASDIVIADETAKFSLSEMLFGLYPACVLPFLIRRIGAQKANYMTIMTQPFSATQAYEWGLVDAYSDKSNSLLRKHLLRLKHLSKTSIERYKNYTSKLDRNLFECRKLAIDCNHEIFSDNENNKAILRYVDHGKFPWQD